MNIYIIIGVLIVIGIIYLVINLSGPNYPLAQQNSLSVSGQVYKKCKIAYPFGI